MTATAPSQLDSFMDGVRSRNPDELEFQQAVEEVAESLLPFVAKHSEYEKMRLLDRLTEPDRVVSFRVIWEDDEGEVQLNRGYRVQFSNTIGPYKGGLRFHPTVTLSVLKFLAFEQIFKNSLTGLPMGGAKGGSDFDPKGKSDREVMRFCQSFMTELFRHVGEDTDIPAGDIGVGPREIGYLFGYYKRLTGLHTGVLTGKGLSYGGSLVRTEATGYGAVYFAREMLARQKETLDDRRCLISGSGNVALYAAEKLLDEGARVVTLSDSDGTIHAPDGLSKDQLAWIKDLKEARRGRIHEAVEEFDGIEYLEGETPWGLEADCAFPCATQNEIDGDAARALTKSGVRLVCEGANMPTTTEGVHHFCEERVLYAPGKAANAGGVSVSGLEQSQNSQRYHWDREEVDRRLTDIMKRIHGKCVEHGERDDGTIDYARGANVAGFVKVADAMLAYGLV